MMNNPCSYFLLWQFKWFYKRQSFSVTTVQPGIIFFPFPTLIVSQLLRGCRIVWCILTSRYLVSLLPVSIIHVSDIFPVGFWSWEISFIMWGCRTWVLVSVKWWDSPPPSGDLEPANQYVPSKSPRESWKARGRLSLNQSPRSLCQ